MFYDSKYTVKNGNLAKKGSKMKNMKFLPFSGILALTDIRTLDIWLNFKSLFHKS